ncbi:uncharacterized protein IUM83_13939 [Phytophthora cinnamomi]|uniref:uncharacterized protein n=1 Tax=Phytophthora cinnamomi TaxID=4785 RepID=UPI003559D971|nr:hypothetical protein IUM83_13939 [Phytophthora cinnamomi]
MSPSKQLRASGSAPSSVTLAALAPLLEFLDARGVATLVSAQKSVGREGCAAVWFWLASRTSALLPGVELPHQPSHSETLQFAIVLPLLRQLQAVATYNFDLHFDAARHGGDVYLVESGDCYVSHWGPNGGSMFGDRVCAPGAVSYWECVGLSEGSYVGISEVITQGQAGFRYYGIDAHHLKRTLSLPTPACDHMPAVMYCESGFITTGSFRGPKPQLPARSPKGKGVEKPSRVTSDRRWRIKLVEEDCRVCDTCSRVIDEKLAFGVSRRFGEGVAAALASSVSEVVPW